MKTKTTRIWILAILAAAVALYQGYHIPNTFGPPHGTLLLMSRGIYAGVRSGALKVGRVMEKDSQGRATPAFQAGLKSGDRIVSFHDARGRGGGFDGLFAFAELTRGVTETEPFTLGISRTDPDGKESRLEIQVQPSPKESPLQGYILLCALAAILLLSMLTAFFIGFSRPEDDNALTACLLLLSFSTLFSAADFSLPPLWRDLALALFITLNGWVVYLFFRFFLLFPSPSAVARRLPWLKGLFFWSNFVIWLVGLGTSFADSYSCEALLGLKKPLRYFDYAATLAILAMFLLGFVSLVFNLVQARSKDDRRRLAILLIGAAVGIIPPLVFFTWMQISGSFGAIGLIFLFMSLFVLFPLSFAYVVLRHRVFGIRLIVRRGLQWALVSRGFLLVEGVLIFAVLFFGMGPALAAMAPQVGTGASAMATAALTGAALFGILQLNRRIMPVIDRRFFREAYDARQILTDLGRAVRSMADDPIELVRAVSEKVLHSLHPSRAAVFLSGEELAALPDGATGLGPWSRARAREMGGAFLWVAGANAGQDGSVGEWVSNTEETPVFPPDALSVESLRKNSREEPSALEVYPDDPRSWAHTLKSAPEGDPRREEGSLLEALNVRLMVPLISKDRLLGFLLLGEKRSEEPYSGEDKELLLAVAQQVAVALDYAELIESAAEQAVLLRDLEAARAIQARYFPAELPSIPGFSVAAVNSPARVVGGDYYDVSALPDGRIALVIADVSGKGMPAALRVAEVHSYLRALLPAAGDAASALGVLNRRLCESLEYTEFVTLFLGILDPATGRFEHACAGHPSPFLKRADGRVEAIEPNGTLPLGVAPDENYPGGSITLCAGDLLFLMTDGLYETMDPAGRLLGLEAVERALEGVETTATPERVLAAVTQIAEAFAAGAGADDDLTAIVLTARSSGSSPAGAS